MRFWQTRIRLGIGGALGLLWASQGVFGAISTAVNHAWAVERPAHLLATTAGSRC